jgi:hypothetical protein
MKWFWILVFMFLSACQTFDYERYARIYRIPDGTVITLNQDLSVAPNQVGTYIQGYQIGDQHRYNANCRLELRTLSDRQRVIAAGDFTVTGVKRESERFSGATSPGVPGVMVASLILGDGPYLLYYATYIYLRSARQPDIFRIKCGHLQDSAMNPRHLTVAEIRVTLEPVMSFRE